MVTTERDRLISGISETLNTVNVLGKLRTLDTGLWEKIYKAVYEDIKNQALFVMFTPFQYWNTIAFCCIG
jgi:hypothetical protein